MQPEEERSEIRGELKRLCKPGHMRQNRFIRNGAAGNQKTLQIKEQFVDPLAVDIGIVERFGDDVLRGDAPSFVEKRYYLYPRDSWGYGVLGKVNGRSAAAPLFNHPHRITVPWKAFVRKQMKIFRNIHAPNIGAEIHKY